MANYDIKKAPISQAVDEAIDATSATARAYRHWQRAMADGQITMDEALEGVRLSERALHEAQEVVPLIEKANEFQNLGLQFARYGTVTAQAAANARTIGIEAPTYDDPRDAA